MATQDYKNHIRFYYPHHFIFYPIVIGAAFVSGYFANKYSENGLVWIAITGLFLMLGWLSFLVRQHYALTNQNRIVRLEMRLRYFILTQKRLEHLEQQLSFGQIAALRFASDEELLRLIAVTLEQKLTPDQIKKKIVNWVADDMRV